MKQLPAETVRLLSSSQVITSVVSVVKELVENSLDAGASSVDVKLENFGLDRIEVVDNGCGIKAADAPVMAVKHYTSKISCHSDLERLETYGFRGEALGSICAVSEVILTTKTADDNVSTQYTLDHNGNVTSRKPSHLGQGATVSVFKLFKNLPVRRQFYSSSKKCKEELRKVQELLMAYGIIRPALRVLLTHNKAVVWLKAKALDHRTALMAALGTSTVASMVPLQHRQEQPEIILEGFFPKPGSNPSLMSSTTPDRTFVFINNRPVHHRDILKLLKRQYGAHVGGEGAPSRYPALMLSVTVTASAVDVNLTPDKTQVMLQCKEAVLLALETMLTSLYCPESSGPPPIVPKDPKCRVEEDPVCQTAPDCPGPPAVDDTAQVTPSDRHSECEKPVSENTTSRSANTSSSSSSEDWVINSSCSFELNLSLTGEDGITNVTGVSEPDIVDGPKPGRDSSSCVPEVSPVSWSMGRGLLDPDTGQAISPMRVHVSVPEPKKAAKLTAYDLISNRTVRQPLSASAMFEQENRTTVQREKPDASEQDVSTALEERWKNLGVQERKKYEEKAEKDLLRYHLQSKRAAERVSSEKHPRPSPPAGPGQKRKAPLSNLQVLDQLFLQPPSKKKLPPEKQSIPVAFSLAALRQRLIRTTMGRRIDSDTGGVQLVGRLPSHSAWVILRGSHLLLLDPSRIEEVLLFTQLLETNIIPTRLLDAPVTLTNSVLGDPANMRALCSMQKDPPELSGAAYFTDPRLVANGFQIRQIPGPLSPEPHLEVAAMADCIPCFGVGDLKEILRAVVERQAASVKECRPLKVCNYLEGEAVRLVRQLPLCLSQEDVRDTLSRLDRQLGTARHTCLHGRPFFHPLAKVPVTEQDPPTSC
ncbi:PMS1 protein homolog 1 isoform X2 [Paramormyrops kingsleyae]